MMSDSNSFPKNPYAGGRLLKAISANKNLKAYEKLVMLTLGGELDYKDFEHSQRYISVAQFSELTSLSRDTVFRVISKLCQNGYIIRENRFDENNRQQSNLYSLTPKIFTEWVCANSTEGSCQPRGGVANSHSNLPQKELPKKNTILGVPNIVCACAPTPNQNIGDPIDEVKVEKKIKPEAKKRKAKASKYTRPPVTQSHQKMARIFTPKPELKSFVHRNDILFAVDELIEEFGEVCHNVIEYFYQWAKNNDKCGNIRWSHEVLRDCFLTAKRKMESE
jgi:DNA-binding MarR family transcriptional regulator